VLGEGDTVVGVLGCREEEIEWGVGYLTLKSPMTSPRNRYHSPTETKEGRHGGSVLGEGDTVVWVLGCRDEEIERGVGYLTLKSPMTPPHKRYRPPTKTKDGKRRGSVLGEGNTVVWVPGCRDEEIEQGVGYSTLKLPMTPPRKHYWPPIKSKDGGRRGSVRGEGDTVVRVLGCQDEEIERGWGPSPSNHRCRRRASVIARPLKPRTWDVEGVFWVREIQ
jgi:hypothetical protein